MFSLIFLIQVFIFIFFIYLLLLIIDNKQQIINYFEGFQTLNPKHLEKHRDTSYSMPNNDFIKKYTRFTNMSTTTNMFQINNLL